MGVRVCKSMCIEEKIMGREVADYVASKERNATPNSCDQQPSVLLFSSLYTQTYIHDPPFPHSGRKRRKSNGASEHLELCPQTKVREGGGLDRCQGPDPGARSSQPRENFGGICASVLTNKIHSVPVIWSSDIWSIFGWSQFPYP